MSAITRIEIGYCCKHEYHLEKINTDDIEVYLDGMFIAGYSNLCSAIGHCVEVQNFNKDMMYVTGNRG